jgi:hypothetical protein
MFDYDPLAGILFWKARGLPFWDIRFAGTRAGSLPKGAKYREVSIDDILYLEHRLIWCLVTGEDPGSRQIDHKNMDRIDNRIENLRLSTPNTNQQNTRPRGMSGLKGAHWNATRGHWQSTIKLPDQRLWLGRFETAEEAHEAYKAAAKRFFGEFAHF